MELSPPDPRVGQVLQGRYRILERVAAGAMGVVYRGERVELGRPVAVKFLHPWIAAQKAFRARFETEARAMSRLAHPNCVSVIDFGVEGAPYLVMDFVTGVTLRKTLESGRLAPPRAVNIARQLLAGVAHAHAQNIIHRDLKPDNLILSDTDGLPDHVRILDFGLAKLRDGPAQTSGLAIGTPSYMSPEQTGAPGEIDGRTDIYSIGVVLHEMLAGEKPFVSDKIAEILVMHRDLAPTPVRKVVPAAEISPALEAVVLRALQKKADDRYQTAAEFVAALEQVPEATVAVKAGAAMAAARPSGAPIADTDMTIIDPPRGVLHGELEAAPAVIVSPEASKPSKPAKAAEQTAERSVLGVTLPKPMRLVALGAMVVGALLLLFVGLGLRRKPSAADPEAAAKRAAPATSPADAKGKVVAHATPGAAATALGAGTAAAAPDGAGAAATRPPSGGPPPAPSARERQADAARLLEKGEWEQALVVLQKAHRENPDDAEVSYALANASLEHKRWGEGAAAARAAAQRDPKYRGDERLVKNLIHALGSDKGYEKTEDVLHGFGAPATPWLKDAAAHDKDPQVRERAADILRSRGTRVSSNSRASTFSRPAAPAPRSSSNRSIFSR
ncbi:MAG TPA: protein kinase [Polyangia bacterium]